jgi:hypothetical protein
MHKRGLLKLTQWEEALSDDEIHASRPSPTASPKKSPNCPNS